MNSVNIYLSEHLCGDLLKEKLVFSLSSGVFLGWGIQEDQPEPCPC